MRHILIALAFASLASAPSTAAGLPPLWSDGKAEISLYEGSVLRYGEERPQELQITVVKEPFDPASLVKSDGASPLEVLKYHAVQSFPTGTYGYTRSWTAFLAPDLSVLKEIAVSVDGCGTTVNLARRPLGGETGDGLVFQSFSYWQGEAESRRRIPDAVGLPYLDVLPIWLRLRDLESPARSRLRVIPSLVGSHTPDLDPLPATLIIGEPAPLRVPAGAFRAVPVEVKLPGQVVRYWFGAEPPHLLLRLESKEQNWDLRKSIRLDYWNYKSPGDEKLLE